MPIARPVRTLPEMSSKTTGRAPGSVRALDFFSQGLRQHVFIEREVGDEPFQSTVFLFHLPEPAQFAHAQMGGLLLPGVEGGVTHPELLAEVADRGAGIDLLLREF